MVNPSQDDDGDVDFFSGDFFSPSFMCFIYPFKKYMFLVLVNRIDFGITWTSQDPSMT